MPVVNGVPVTIGSRFHRHSKVRTTLRYGHLSDNDIQAAAKRIGAAMAQVVTLIEPCRLPMSTTGN